MSQVSLSVSKGAEDGLADSPAIPQRLNNLSPAPGGWKNTACCLVSMETRQYRGW